MSELYTRNVLQDPELMAEFARNGYVIIRGLLNADEVAQLRKKYDEMEGDLNKGFHATMHSRLPEYRRQVSEVIGEVFTPKANKLLDNYKHLVSNYTIKEPGEDSFFDFHLDWTMVDERKYTSITIWCALEDIDWQKGPFCLLKGSNNMGYTIRSSPGLSLYVEDPEGCAAQQFEHVEFDSKAGDAIIYDHRLFHGSPPNLGNEKRMAINQAMIPAEINSYHYHQIDDETIEVFEVDDDFYSRYIIGTRPEGAKSLGYIKVKPQYWYQEDINALCPDFKILA